MCKRYKGPHSVLQVFLEKIIDCIWKIHWEIKEFTKNELKLWTDKVSRKSSNNLSSSSEKLLIKTTTSSQSDNSTGISQDNIIKKELKFEPFMPNIDAYMKFLEEVQKKYTFIMN